MKKIFQNLLLATILVAASTAVNAQPPNWLTAGNNGAGNFKLGNKDNYDLKLITNNTPRVTIKKQTGYVGIGLSSPLQLLDVNGNINIASASALYMGNVRTIHYAGGGGNFFAGQGAGDLIQTGGQFNTAFGQDALNTNSTGDGNSAFGFLSMYNLDPGNNNTAMGLNSMYRCMVGNSNAAFGTGALNNLEIGDNNTAVGAGAMGIAASTNSLSFSGNTACGTNALGNFVLGGSNTAVGYLSSLQNYGDNCITTLGYAADVNTTYNIMNSTAIGCQSLITASDQVRIGNSSVTSIGGYVNWTNISDKRVKKNIQENVPGLAFINKLKPVTYNLDLTAIDNIVQRVAIKDANGKIIQPSAKDVAAKNAKQKILYTGFVAQDVEQAAKDLNYDFSGVDIAKNDKDMYGLRYADFVVPLTKAVQELSKQNDDLQGQNTDLQKQLLALSIRIEALEKGSVPSSQNNAQSISSNNSYLYQITPNPFSQKATISFKIPSSASNAQLLITDAAGKTIKTYMLSTGSTQQEIYANDLAAGIYNYSLFVNGKMIDSKQMMITK